MSDLHYLIIGNGTAGTKAAAVLRAGDENARITIVSAEPTPYLKRHALAAFLTEDRPLQELAIHEPSWYDDRDLRLRKNQPVVKLNVREKCVLLAHRERVHYDKLLICSGAGHRVPEYLSHFADLLTVFSTGVAAMALKPKLKEVTHVTLVGGDAIGLQLGAALLALGKKVTMVMDEHHFWPLEWNDEVKADMAEVLEAKGIEVLRDDFVEKVSGSGTNLVIQTRGGREFGANLALLCEGMTPKLEFLSDSGVDVQEGVLVNSRLETSVPEVWAAGDCAQLFMPELGAYQCSTGYTGAAVQGTVAAKNMLGANEEAGLCEIGHLKIGGKNFSTHGWKGFTFDETS